MQADQDEDRNEYGSMKMSDLVIGAVSSRFEQYKSPEDRLSDFSCIRVQQVKPAVTHQSQLFLWIH